MAKAKKKNTQQVQMSVSQEESVQAQQVLAQYHQLAGTLHQSGDRGQVDAALTEINALPEGVQLLLVKELSKEKHADAADVLTAIYELSSLKSVHKEAKRSLIRLEASRIYPGWRLPVERTSVFDSISAATSNRRFWKGLVTDSLDVGEVQLLLCWEQGDNYKDVRVLGFLLDYSFAGVRDFFTQVESKRSFEKFVTRMIEETPDVEFEDCSLARGRRLLLDALDVNKQCNSTPHKDYRFNLSLINELILEVPDLSEELEDEDEEVVDLHDASPEEVVMYFVRSWADEDYDMAYQCLSEDSELHAGLAKDEWVELRTDWAEDIEPANFKPEFAFELKEEKPKLWLPARFQASSSPDRRVVEAGWSIEFNEVPLISSLPELPEATMIYQITGRHWFWLSYTLVRENDAWHIQSIMDEGAEAQNLSVSALQKHVQDLDEQINVITKNTPVEKVLQLSEEEAVQEVLNVLAIVFRATHYYDILIKKEPLTSTYYEKGAVRMLTFAQYERCLSYLIPLAEQFPEQRAENLSRIGLLYQQLSEKYGNDESDDYDEDRSEHYLELAETALREWLAIEDCFDAHMSLAEVLVGYEDEEKLDEARVHLLQTKALATDADQEAQAEFHLGEIALLRDQFQDALLHYQRVVDLQPSAAASWSGLGRAHKELGNFAEAESSYRRAIELEPTDDDYYYALSTLYTDNDQPIRAMKILEEGLQTNPDSVALRFCAATLAMENKEYRTARTFLDEASRLEPDSETVAVFRQVLNVREELDQSRESEQRATRRLNPVSPSKQKTKRKR